MKHAAFSFKQLAIMTAIGFLVGALWIVALRMFTIPDPLHYHANFALYINGDREEFDGPGYYEEVTACAGNDISNPKIRTHMHDKINSVVHVHDEAVTWGAFFSNLGYRLGDEVLETPGDILVSGADAELIFVHNGKRTDSVANKVIGNEDTLLVSYGSPTDAEIQTQYESIKQDADQYNQTADPSACSGSAPLTLTERFKQSIGLQ